MGLFNKKQKKEQNTVAPAQSVAPEMNAAPMMTPAQPAAPAAPDFSSQLGEQAASPNQITEIQAPVSTSVATPAPTPTELVPESPSMGLMENDPFTEKSEVTPGEIEATTGAQVEEPNPILEQQIALDVNIEEVIEDGTTKEDEITKIVADNVAAAAVAQTITNPTPEVSQAPTTETPAVQAPEVSPAPEATQQPEQPTIESNTISETTPAPDAPQTPEASVTPTVEAPTPEVPVAPEVTPQPEQPVLTLEPGPITAPQPGLPVAEPVPTTAPTVNAEVPTTPEVQTPAPEINPIQEVATQTPEVPTTPEVTQQPVLTLEPGPITSQQPSLPVAEPVPAPETAQTTVPAPAPEIVPTPEATPTQEPALAPEIAPTLETTLAPEIAPTPEIALAPEIAPTPETTPEVPVTPEVVTPEAAQAQTNPFNGVEAPTVTENEIVAPTMDIAEQQMQNINPQPETTPQPEQPALNIEQGPILNQIETNNLEEQDLSKFFVDKNGVMVSQENPNAEIPTILETPQPEQPAPQLEEPVQANLNIDIQNPTTESTVEQPTSSPTVPEITNVEQTNVESETQQPEENVQQPEVEDTMVQPETPKTDESLVPKPVVAPIREENEQPVEQPQQQVNVDKKVIVQSASLGRVQPVAPIAVLDDKPEDADLSLTQKLNKIKLEEQNTQIGVEVTSIEEAEQPSIESQPSKIVPSKEPVVISTESNDAQAQTVVDKTESETTPSEPVIKNDEPVKEIEQPVVELQPLKHEQTPEPQLEQETNLDVEKQLYTTVEQVPQKMSRNSRRKILRGQERFKAKDPKEEIITEPIVEKKGLLFCESCGNLISSVDVICPSCGDPIK